MAASQGGHKLPVNLKLFVEGMEGEPDALRDLVLREAEDGGFLADVDSFCASVNSWLGPRTPCLTYGLRGLVTVSVTVTLGSHDLTSGSHGGALREPMLDIAMLAASVVSPTGVILIDGVNELVAPLGEDERQLYNGLDFECEEYRRTLEINGPLAHGSAETVLMHRWRYPTLSIHSIRSTASACGEHHIIPASATLQFSMRLVPDMEPVQVERLTRRHLTMAFARLSSGNRFEMDVKKGARPWLTDWHHPNYEAAKRAVQSVYGAEPDMTREGTSLAIASILEEATGKSLCLLPLAASDDCGRTANEKVDRGHYLNGIKVIGRYLEETCAGDSA